MSNEKATRIRPLASERQHSHTCFGWDADDPEQLHNPVQHFPAGAGVGELHDACPLANFIPAEAIPAQHRTTVCDMGGMYGHDACDNPAIGLRFIRHGREWLACCASCLVMPESHLSVFVKREKAANGKAA